MMNYYEAEISKYEIEIKRLMETATSQPCNKISEGTGSTNSYSSKRTSNFKLIEENNKLRDEITQLKKATRINCVYRELIDKFDGQIDQNKK